MLMSKVGPDLEWTNIVNNAHTNMKESGGQGGKKGDSQKQDDKEA